MWLPETAPTTKRSGSSSRRVGFRSSLPSGIEWRDAGGDWRPVEEDPIDPRVAYRYEHRDGSGRSLTLFFYDGDVSHAIAFGDAGSSAEKFVDLFGLRASADGGLVHAATDGETYGHHHVFTDLGLAYALFVEAPERGIEVTNYAAYLERERPCRGKDQAGRGQLVVLRARSRSLEGGLWLLDGGGGVEPGVRGPLRDALEVVRAAADETSNAWRRLVPDRGPRDDYVHAVIGAVEPEGSSRATRAGP